MNDIKTYMEGVTLNCDNFVIHSSSRDADEEKWNQFIVWLNEQTTADDAYRFNGTDDGYYGIAYGEAFFDKEKLHNQKVLKIEDWSK